MTQKELCYIEDIYNHELLVINMITDVISRLDDETYEDFLENQLEKHEKFIKDLDKLMECEINA